MVLPREFLDKMEQLLGEETESYLTALKQPPVHGLRVNTSKCTVSEAIDKLPFHLIPVPWADNGFVYDAGQDRPSLHPYYHCGLYYLQEPSAMAPASFLPVETGERVLDLCAAPGGKTTQLAIPLQESGLLVSNDISASRAKALIKNIELSGLRNTVVTCESPDRLAGQFPGYFDKILVDAPCSGEGMFRQGERMWRAWQEHGPEYFAPVQREVITAASRMLAPGGMLLYSTCTFDPRENEQVIEYLLDHDPTLHMQPLPQCGGTVSGRADLSVTGRKDLEMALRFYPHRVQGEGHFVAMMKKDGVPPAHLTEGNVIKEHLVGRGKAQRQMRVEVPAAVADIAGIRFLRSGLTLGEVKGDRLVPSQAYAMTLKKGDHLPELDLDPDDERTARYLRGESLQILLGDRTGEGGDILILIGGYPAGWGRIQGNRIKNDLLPGWRRQA